MKTNIIGYNGSKYTVWDVVSFNANNRTTEIRYKLVDTVDTKHELSNKYPNVTIDMSITNSSNFTTTTKTKKTKFVDETFSFLPEQTKIKIDKNKKVPITIKPAHNLDWMGEIETCGYKIFFPSHKKLNIRGEGYIISLPTVNGKGKHIKNKTVIIDDYSIKSSGLIVVRSFKIL